MPTAYIVDSGTPNNDASFPFNGPFKYNGQDYVIGFSGSGDTVFASVYKSNQQPATTFTALDVANQPAVGEFTCYYPVVKGVFQGSTIYFAYRTALSPSDQNIVLQTFNLATGLWGSTIGGGPVSRATSPMILSVTGSKWKIFYEKFSGSFQLYYATYNGAWSGETLIQAVAGIQLLLGATNHSNGDFCAVWNPNNSNNSLKAVTLGASSLSTPVTQTGIVLASAIATGAGVYIPETDQFAFAFVQRNNVDSFNEIDLLLVSPSTVPTTTSIETAVPETGNSNIVPQRPSLDLGSDNKLYLFYQLFFDATTSSQVVLTTRDDTGGSWTPTVIFDSNVDPFVPPQPLSSKENNQPYGSIYPNRELAVQIGAFAQFGSPICDIQFFFSVPGVPEITLTFNLKGAAPPAGLELVSVQPPNPGPPGPVVTPTECINQQ